MLLVLLMLYRAALVVGGVEFVDIVLLLVLILLLSLSLVSSLLPLMPRLSLILF